MPAKGSGTGTGSAPRQIRISCGVTMIAVVVRAAIRVTGERLIHLLQYATANLT
jgi:hypothetical protein